MNDQYQNFITGVNAGKYNEITFGNLSGNDEDDTIDEKRRRINPLDVEFAVTLLVAELAGLKLNEEIFVGQIPAYHPTNDGVTVRLDSETPSVNPLLREYDFLCFGKYPEREKILLAFSLLSANFPLPAPVILNASTLSTPIIIAAGYQVAKTEFSTIADNGQIKTLGILSIKIQLCVNSSLFIKKG